MQCFTKKIATSTFKLYKVVYVNSNRLMLCQCYSKSYSMKKDDIRQFDIPKGMPLRFGHPFWLYVILFLSVFF